ncbi:MAG: hypothetical protein EXR81_04080 [Gammaproteobacteria bacterium]|nr:hypothetical protein [Gammaproteobacteria bacterium]
MLEHQHFIKEVWDDHVSDSVKKMTYAIIIGLFSYAVSYATSVIVARVLGVKVFGEYAATTSSLLMIAGFILFGADAGLSRFIPTYLKNQDYAGFSGYLRYFNKWILIVDLMVFSAGILVMLILYYLTGEHVLNIKQTHPLYFFLWGVPFLAFLIYVGKFIRASNHGSFSLFMLTALRPILTLSSLSIFLLFVRRFTVAEALMIYFLATFLAIVIGFIFAYLKTELPKLKLQTPRYESKNWRVVTQELYFLNISISFIGTFLLIISSIFDSNHQLPGFIAAVFMISNLMWVINSAILSVMSPKITTTVGEKDKKQISSLLFNAILISGASSGAIFIVMIIWGKEWLVHFGSEFVAAYPLLLIIGGTIFITVTFSPLGWIFQQSGKLKGYMYFSVISVLIYIVLGYFGALLYGGFGAVIAYVLMQLSSIVYLIILAIKNWNNPDFAKA